VLQEDYLDRNKAQISDAVNDMFQKVIKEKV